MTLRRSDLAVSGVALALLLLWDASGVDLGLVRAWGTPAGFPWRDHWLTSHIAHDGGRWFTGAVLAMLVVNVWRPLFSGLSRAERVRWLLVTLAALALVPLLKKFSATSCPYELAEFGGRALYVSHWRFGMADGGPGGCFPSGHATAGAALFSGWFALRDRHPVAARRWLAATLAATLFFGWAQMVRGAHYPSHTMWSAWLCWTLAMLTVAPARRVAQPATP
jgi:membrane-associated PAP2 superfamily phosphatase